MKKILCLAAFVLSIITACKSGKSTANEKERIARPNIVFILAGDMGYTDAGFTGSDLYQIPNLDKLALRACILKGPMPPSYESTQSHFHDYGKNAGPSGCHRPWKSKGLF